MSKPTKMSGDRRYMDEIGRSLCWSTDLVPWKPHTDFFVLGAWFAPGGLAVSSGEVGFTFGPLHKHLRVRGPRVAIREGVERSASPDWHVSEAQPITQLPLRWEFSAGGLRDRRNPFGLGQDEEVQADGRRVVRMPQIERPDQPHHTPEDRHAPANMAPVPPRFLERHRKLGTRDQRWATFRAPLPPKDYDPSFTNAAPEGQVAANRPRGDETITLLNMHPEHPRLHTALPAIRPVAAGLVVGDRGPRAEWIELELDTVIVTPERLELTLLWRGIMPLHEDRSEAMEALSVRLVPCEASADAAGDLPAALLRANAPPPAPDPGAARAAAENEATEAAKAAAAEEASLQAMLADARKLAADPAMPPRIRALFERENDPIALHDGLVIEVRRMLAEAGHPVPEID